MENVRLKAFSPALAAKQPRQGRQMRIWNFQFLFPSQTSHVLSIFNFSWLSFPFFLRSFSIRHCDKRDSKFNVLVGKAWTGRWFHFRIVNVYKSKFFFAEIYSIQFRLMKGFLRGIDENEACVKGGLLANESWIFIFNFLLQSRLYLGF